MNYLRFVENQVIYVATTVPSLLTRLLKDGSQYLELRWNSTVADNFP